MIFQKRDVNDNFDNIVFRVRKFMEEKGIAETFPYIKSLDTIEITGSCSNGGERVLLNDIMDEFGEEEVKNSQGYRYLLSCIPEGVVKCRRTDGIIYYNHFKLVDCAEKSFGLEMQEYHFHDSSFYLRYIIKVSNISNTIDENVEGEMDVELSCLQQFMIDSFPMQELRKEFTEEEIEVIKRLAQKDDEHLSKEVEVIITYMLSTFQAINFLNEYNKPNRISGERSTGMIVNNENNYVRTDSRRIIDTTRYYNIVEGKKDRKSTVSKERKIVRKTDKWMVGGHVRHYKSGKVIFVKAYYKGPNRDKDEKPKTTYRIQ